MPKHSDVSNSDDVIDGRDIIARIDEPEELEESLNAAREAYAEAKEDGDDLADLAKDIDSAESDFGKDEQEELKTLRNIVNEAGSELRHGEALIRDTYFKEYAQQLAEDVGDLDKNPKWPYTCIDWDQAADELKQDYTAVDFDGVEYLTRA